MNARRLSLSALALLVLSACVVRLWGLDFGAGFELHPDEWRVLRVAAKLVKEPAAPVRFWAYPPALANLISLPLRGCAACASDVAGQQLVGRAVVFAMSVLACLASAWSAYRIQGAAAGWFALAVSAFSPLWVEQSRYATPDLPTAFGTALVTLAVTFLLARPDWLRYAAAGAAVGLAAAFKYIGAASGLLVLFACLSGRALRAVPRLLFAGALSLVAFIALNQELLREGSEPMFSAIRDEFIHYAAKGSNGYSSDLLWRHVLVYWARYALGPAATVTALVACARAISPSEARRLPSWPFAAAALSWLLFLCTRETFFARNLLHVLPLFSTLAGVGFAALWARAGRPSRVLALGLVALQLWPAWQTARFAWRLREPDTRIEAAGWIREHVPARERIAVVPETYGHYLPPAPLHGHRLESQRGFPSLAQLRESFGYLVVSSGQVSRYLRSPAEFPERAREFTRWHEALVAQLGAPVRVFEKPAAPGAELFGATSDAYHNPRIEIFRLAR